ncbi:MULTISPECIES: S-layer homology domain-containing protein [unclassified Sporosarcina]|uniref:S-layer homology domain-containing protein n=1 Tax=unclassified Sporosarcina TaxID=2647733 RepID=UPI001A912FE0|nr:MULTISPECIES: S-layer homology domain-containing protein [unclassified Sporosarcina]MBO0589274.1 S-layer homology domain-containing protein [Sporosarcina sp. E16_8]MBO0601981.1 S-layer homology domain-containing protein [Sporosarcina sp. E16_3]
MKNNLFIATLASAIVIPAIIAPIQANAVVKNPFTDVSKNSPYYDVIHEMRDKNIISGYENGAFKPNEVITRKHAAALVSRAKDLPSTKDFVKFNDITEKNAYFLDIKKLQQAGIFEPDNKGNFNPNKPITRAEMAKVLTIAFDLKPKTEFNFPDVPKNHSANEYVRALYSNGITTGDNGYFKPAESLTRAHYAVFMHRAMNMKDDVVVKPIPESKPNVPASSMKLEDFNKSITNNPLFQSKINNPTYKQGMTNSNTYNADDLRTVLTDGQAIVKGTGLKYANIGGNIVLMEDNYVSSLPNNHPQLTITSSNDGHTGFYIDYTNKISIDTAINLFEMMYPQFDLEDEIRTRAKEADNALKSEGHKPPAKRVFQGNGEIFKANGYEAKVGANAFLNYLWIEVKDGEW